MLVADSGPIINLSAIHALDLLFAVAGRVVVPQSVWREVVVDGVGRPGAAELAARHADVDVVQVPPPSAPDLQSLGRGEADAIAWAVASAASILALDDLRGRRIARRSSDGKSPDAR